MYNTEDARFISKAEGTAVGEHTFMFGTEDTDTLKARLDVDNMEDVRGTAGVLSNNTWHNAIMNYDGTNIKLYLDGVEVDSEAATGNIDAHSWRHIYIGANPGATPGPRNFSGILDEIYLWNKSLNASEIADLSNNSWVSAVQKPLPLPDNQVVLWV